MTNPPGVTIVELDDPKRMHDTIAEPIGEPKLPAVADRHAKIAERKSRKQEGSIVNIATAIASVTREVGIVAKEGFNRFHNYKYAQMQDILQKLTPLIAKHGLIIVQTELVRTMFDDDRAVAVEYEFTLAHISGEIWPDRPKQTGLCRCRDSKGGFDDKAFNKCHTAARKYFLLALFQIATGDEDDADEHDASAPRQPSKPAPNALLHDPKTGEITEEKSAAVPPQPAEDAALPSIDSEGRAAVSVEDMAREAAQRGEAIFRTFYRNRSGTEQMRVNAIGDELRELMNEAKEKSGRKK